MKKVFYKLLLSRLILPFCISFIISDQASGQDRSIRFLNKLTERPVADVVVNCNRTGDFMSSNEAGFITLPEGTTSIWVSCIGYLTMAISTDTLKYTNDKTTILMEPTIMTLEEIIITSGMQQSVYKEISDLDIHMRPINNSQEVLRMVPGLFIGQHAGGGKAEQLFLRGFDIDHGTDIQISVDGMPVNMVSHAHGQGYADLHFVIPELIDRVQFDKGPYFGDHGNLATAGYVDFRTKNVLDRNFIKVEGGQFSTLRGLFGANLIRSGNEEKSLLMAGEGYYTRGYFDSPQGFRRFNGLLKYNTRLNRHNDLNVTFSGFTSRWNASGQIPNRAVSDGLIGFYGAIDDTEGGETSRYNASATLTSKFKDGSRWINQIYYNRYQFLLYSNFTFFLRDSINGDQIRQAEKRNLTGINSKYSKQYQVGGFRLITTAGLQMRTDIVDDIELSHTKDREILLNPIKKGDIREVNPGIWFQQEIRLDNGLEVDLGARLDYFRNEYIDHLENNRKLTASSMIFSPKVRLNYSVNSHWKIYWYGGKGFHSNDTRVAVEKEGKEVVTPAWGSDLGTIVKLGEKALLQSALWYLYMQQEFIYVGDEGIVEPSGRTQRLGLALSLRYQPTQRLYFDIDLNLSRPKAIDEAQGEDFLPLAPIFTSTGGVSYKTPNGWNGSLRYRWMGNRPANEDYSTVARGYFITDLSVNYTKPRWEVGLVVQNAFNRRWKETQFDTESRLMGEIEPVTEIHFTPGSPFMARLNFSCFF
ncbi:MAG TPA: TonB-dependent receptor plug domain-containing protein [Saprospiraceae bacterium]|jgi:outer membrane receptor protein involved in Fe transport|nr:TonB-dependent receptor plug domain-containing protein [Saprospiraceae bacterium]HRN33668.1 TonB-dependent receptor plug domain-containing protein [Saprospiraceae bacterium]